MDEGLNTPVVKKVTVVKKEAVKEVKKTILKNTSGKEVDEGDYFYSNEGLSKGKAPNGFSKTCGYPVEREDLVGVFNKIFKPEDGVLFYKQPDKEVYLVIVPIKYSASVGEHNGSLEGDFQKHAISFLNEGSVNLDTLKTKLKRIVPFVKYNDR